MPDHSGHLHGEHAARTWDGFYTGNGDDVPHWSGRPNPTLVAEASDLRPGRALDVGCGEGGDAIWLARGGWHVTAIDPSEVALARARTAAGVAGVDVTWIAAGLLDLLGASRQRPGIGDGRPDDAGVTGTSGYDLVAAHYAVLSRSDDDAAAAALLRAVAPGGTLLFVHHELDAAHAVDQAVDRSGHLSPDGLASHLDGRWDIEVFAPRDHPRDGAPPGQNPRDIVLRARRR